MFEGWSLKRQIKVRQIGPLFPKRQILYNRFTDRLPILFQKKWNLNFGIFKYWLHWKDSNIESYNYRFKGTTGVLDLYLQHTSNVNGVWEWVIAAKYSWFTVSVTGWINRAVYQRWECWAWQLDGKTQLFRLIHILLGESDIIT